MITEVYIRDNEKAPIRYLSKLDNFKNGTKYEFKKGVNIIVGENGSGKSTISKMIFSVIKAVANTAQENESSQQIRLEKLATSLYKRLTMRN